MHVGNPRLYTHFPPGHVDKKTSFIVEKIAKRIPIREIKTSDFCKTSSFLGLLKSKIPERINKIR